MSRRSRILSVAVILACVIGGILLFLRELTHIDTAEHVIAANISWLPAGATDVCYYNSYAFNAYEFQIDEPAFDAWCKDNDWTLQLIDSDPFTIKRYLFPTEQRNYPKSPTANDDATQDAYRRQLAEWSQRTEKIITHGKGYYHEIGQSGGFVSVGYDRDNGRAYYPSTPR